MRYSWTLILVLALLIPGTIFLPSPAKGSSGTYSWPQFRHDSARTGSSQGPSPTTNATLWQALLFGDVVSSAAVTEGVVYVGSYDRRVYALRASDGDFVWNYTTGGRVESSPAVAGGRLFVGSDDKRVYALNSTTGSLLWKYQTSSWVVSSPTVADGKVVVGSLDGDVYALNVETGAKVWEFTTNGSVYSSPAIFGSKVFIGSSNGTLYALDLLTGTKVWNYTTGGAIYSTPATLDGTVYVGSADGYLYALNAATGGLRWSYHTSSFIVSSPALAYGKVFFGSYDKNVYALRQTDGLLIWRYTTSSYVSSDPSVAAGRVFIGSYDGYVYAFSESTGTLLWRYHTGGSVVASPALADGRVYIGSKSDYLFAFGDATPPVTTLSVGQPKSLRDSTTYVAASTPITLTASDNIGVMATQFNTDGGPWQAYATPFTLSGLSEGIHTIYFNSTDASGNVEEAHSQQLFIDKTPPRSWIVLLPPGTFEFYVNQSASFAILSSDSASGVKETAYRIDAGPWRTYTGSFNLAGYADGEHAVEFNSTDNVENREAVNRRDIMLDNTPPETSASYVEATSAVTLWATDAGAGVQQTFYRIDQSRWTLYQAPLVILQRGEHVIEFYSLDHSANREQIKSLTFRVPGATPSPTPTPPPVPTFGDGFLITTLSLLAITATARKLSKKDSSK